MKDPFEYDVFLSFSSSDEELVKPIWQELSLSGLRVFWSDESLKKNIGQSFFGVIQDALTHSRHFVLICTPSSMKSNWVREEYEAFFSQCYIPSRRERRLVLFSGKDFIKSTLPTLLKNIQCCESVKEVVTTLGGVNTQALIDENSMQKKQLVIAADEIKKLKNELAESKKENKALQDKLGFSNLEVRKLIDELNSYKDKRIKPKKPPGELKPKKPKRPETITEPGFNPAVDSDKCEGCEECLEVCPVEVFEMRNEKAVPVNAEECLGCESCVEICEPGAITVGETT